MKPKVSTGYFTPQAKKTKSSARNRLSDTEGDEGATGFNESLFQALLKCPEKKKLVMQLLAANKETLKKYSKNDVRKSIESPANRLRSKKKTCESPTALFRRRALEQMTRTPSTSNKSSSHRPSSTSSDSSSSHSSSLPFERVLDGVIAYVEIKSRLDADRSGGAKAVLKSMGATIRETFTNDVTHVIFKDGSYTTFQRAKLKKIHLVSILWVEFCRKTKQKQNEKQYPAMRGGFDDETMVCSQMQKEYEDIIREEYRRSIVEGTPLPTTKSLIDRRRTLMTPTISSSNPHRDLTSSSTSFKTAADTISSQELSDREVAAINGFQTKENIGSDSLIINDTGCFSEASGPVVDGSVVENQKLFSSTDCSDMELTHVSSKSPAEMNYGIWNMDISKKNNYKDRPKARSPFSERRKTVGISLLSSDSSTMSSDKSRNNSSLISSDKSTNVSNEASSNSPKPTSQRARRLTRASASSLLESESFIEARNSVKVKKVPSIEIDKTASAISMLNLGSKTSAQTSTSMSSLRISSESAKQKSTSDLVASKNPPIANCDAHQSSVDTSKSVMSTLQISSEKQPSLRRENDATDCSMPSLQISKESSPTIKTGTAKPSIRALQAPEFITVRRKVTLLRSGSESSSSDSSEILLPSKHVRGELDVNNTEPARKDDNLKNKKLEKEVVNSGKSLIVNIVRSPLDALGNGEKNRRKTLGPREVRKPKTPSLTRSRRKTMFSQEVQRVTSIEVPGNLLDDISVDSASNKKNRPKTRALSEIQRAPQNSSDSASDGSDNADLPKVTRRFRKLYNPDDSIHIEVDDDMEREEKRHEARKRNSEGVSLNPIQLFITSNKTPPTSDVDIIDITPPKRTRKAKKTVDEVVQLDSSADEQKELLNEILAKKNDVPPSLSNDRYLLTQTPSRRKSTRTPKPVQKFSINEKVRVTPVNRRSTLEFMSASKLTSGRKKLKKTDKTKLPTIVCTKLHKPDVQVFTQIVKKLGRFNVEDEVSDKTTHLVAGESKRTINMLRGISRGCWVLKFEWVLESLEAGRWLSEEDFEVTNFSPAVQKCRLERQAFGAKYTSDVFESCPPIYVAPSTNPRSSDLKELITTCKGKVVTASRMAKIVVGQYLKQEETVCVDETWILDCITFYRNMPFKRKYLLSSKRKSLDV